MTREEYKKEIFNEYSSTKVYKSAKKYIKSLEAQLKAKDDEIELLKFIVEESIKKPMGVEPHSWSDYKMSKDRKCGS